ncbi:MAG: IS1634 family transposase [Clostridiales Family XIII bacterium]|nr:IS1634 family transposase [Clostridiales Family XIII bacterium]
MAQHLTKRKKGQKTYYYLAQTSRVNGKPRQAIIKSLGTADDIGEVFKAANNPQKESPPDFCRIYDFGAEAALLNVAERLGVSDLIDEKVQKRNQGLSVGSYMVLAAINRVVSPISKNSFHEWFQKTVLSWSFPKANEKTLSGQSFWNHMLELDQGVLSSIEDELAKRIVNQYNISTECLLFDNTNFITYIDTSNDSLIPQRGHSKEKRSDLKIIGLSLMVSQDYNIPLFHSIYPGNVHDSTQFTNIINSLKQRVSLITNKTENITLVFDKGNNSERAIELLENKDLLNFHFIGGLRLNQCPELLELKKEQFSLLEGIAFKGTSAYRLRKEIYGRELTVIITDNPNLREAQLRGLKTNIDKCERELSALQDSLKLREEGKIVRGRKRTTTSVTKNVEKILSAEHMKKIFKYNISSIDNIIYLSYNIDNNKYDNLVNNHLGKTILFTNRDDWSNEKIVSTYRSQFRVEESFKQMKDIKYLSFRPVRHFTDRMIIVHAFYCVLAYTLSCLLQLEINKLGYKFSINVTIDTLKKAKQCLNIYTGDSNGKSRMVSVFSENPPAADAYIAKYDLKKYSLNLK